jgi:hypothetical protein
VVPGLLDRFNNISKITASLPLAVDQITPEIQSALALMGLQHFATLTVNNFDIVQRTTSSFSSYEMFFGRKVSAVISEAILHRLPEPVHRQSGTASCY